VLSHGRVIAEGDPDTVLAADDVARELLGLTATSTTAAD